MTYDFKKPEKRKKNGNDGSDFAKAREHEAFLFARDTDGEFFLCPCFRSEDERIRFADILGAPHRRFVKYEEIAEGMERFRPKQKKKVFPRQFKHMTRTPDPWADLEPTDDLEADCIREAYVLLDALKNVKPPDPLVEIIDSDIWTCIVFDSSDDAVAFVDDFMLGKFGDKYMDGSGWLEMMESATA